MEDFARTNFFPAEFPLAVHQPVISVPQDGAVAGSSVNDDRGKLIGNEGFDGHGRNVNACLADIAEESSRSPSGAVIGVNSWV